MFFNRVGRFYQYTNILKYRGTHRYMLKYRPIPVQEFFSEF